MGRKRDAHGVTRKLSEVVATIDGARARGKLDYWSAAPDRFGRFDVEYRARLSGGCRDPYRVFAKVRPDGTRHAGMVKRMRLETVFPCRKCKWCRFMKSAEWGDRALVEFERHAVTWLGTIELSPQEHAHVDLIRDQDTGGDRARVFLARAEVMGGYVQDWLEAVRNRAARRLGRRPRFKYLCAVEEHKGQRGKGAGPRGGALLGFPHFHLLLHEEQEGELVTPGLWPAGEYYVTKKGDTRVDDRASLRQAWPFEGFTQFDRMDADEGWRTKYVCAYLGKDGLDWRVRASKRYGEPVSPEASEAEPSSERLGEGAMFKVLGPTVPVMGGRLADRAERGSSPALLEPPPCGTIAGPRDPDRPAGAATRASPRSEYRQRAPGPVDRNK